MLKVLLVDDEFLVRLAFSNMISWKENGFELIATASNGSEAFEIIQREMPDIVITDLTMPQMSGLELIKKVKSTGIPCEFVVLSCHNEFEYVKEALKLGVFDYILKLSMNMEELMDVLNRLREKVRSQNPGKVNEATFFEQQELEDALFRVIIVDTDSCDDEEEKNRGRIREQIVSILGQMTESVKNKSVFLYHNVPILLLWETCKNLDSILSEIQEEIKKYLGISVSIGVGSLVCGNQSIRRSFEEAEEAYGHRFYRGEEAITYYEKLHYLQGKGFMEIFPGIHEMLIAGVGKEIRGSISETLIRLRKEEEIEPERMRMNIHELLTRLKLRVDAQKPGAIDEKVYMDLYKRINQMPYLDDIIQEFTYFMDGVLEKLELKAENDIVRAVKRYVHEHLSEDLRVIEVSRKLGINADYMSHVFRQETGIRYIDYVNHVRIEKARDLLKGSRNKIYEIGELSGFENTNYFIKVFKRFTGMTPSDWRKSETEGVNG